MKRHLFNYFVIGSVFFIVSYFQCINAFGKNTIDNSVLDKVILIAEKYYVEKNEILLKNNVLVNETKGNSNIIHLKGDTDDVTEEYIFTEDIIKSVRIRDGNGDGYDISFYENGQLNTFFQYKNNKLHGYFIKYYENGNLQNYAECENGKFVNKANRLDKSGKTIESTEFDDPVDITIEN